MPHDPLEVIAESYRLSAHTQLLLVRMQAFVVVLAGFALLVLGFTVWQHVVMHRETLALHQDMAAQTRLILERLSQH